MKKSGRRIRYKRKLPLCLSSKKGNITTYGKKTNPPDIRHSCLSCDTNVQKLLREGFKRFFSPVKIYYPMIRGKRWGEERRRVEKMREEGKEERRKRRKEGRATLPLVKNRKISRFLDTPCGQNLCEILSTENRGTVPARDCGWTKIFIGYKMYLLSLTTTKSIGKHLLKSCLWYNCQYIISAGGGLVSKLCPTVETPRTGTC